MGKQYKQREYKKRAAQDILRLEFPDCSRLLPGFVLFKIFTLFFCTEPTSPVGFFTASGLHGNCRLESATPVAHSCTLNRRVSVCAADASSSVLGREAQQRCEK